MLIFVVFKSFIKLSHGRTFFSFLELNLKGVKESVLKTELEFSEI